MEKEFLTLEDIKVGDRVDTGRLLRIYNTYILLSNTYVDNNTSFTNGIVEYIGEKNQNMLDVYNNCVKKYGRRPMVIHNEYTGGIESWDHF